MNLKLYFLITLCVLYHNNKIYTLLDYTLLFFTIYSNNHRLFSKINII
jgi:hypothetical protein